MNSASRNTELATAAPNSQSVDENTKEAVLLELGRVLGSQAFRSSDRSRQFLAHVVHNSLAGRTDNLKERSIGVEVYHRKADYATGEDPVVRISAGEVRKRLEQYYGSAPPDTTLRIEIPRGSYAPEFHWTASTSRSASDLEPVTAGGQVAAEPGHAEAVSVPELRQATPEAAKPSGNIRRKNTGLLIAVSVIVALTFGCLFLWLQLRAFHRSVSEWRYEPATHALWSKFLDSNRDTDVITEDSSYLLLQSISKQRFSLQDYLNQDYVSHLLLRDSSGDYRTALNLIATKDLGRADDIKLVQRIVALDPLGSKLHTYSARTYTPALASADNMIVVGGELSNPWAELFDNRMNFISDSKGVNAAQTVIRNRMPAAGEQEIYAPISSEKPTVEYCSIAYLPTPNHSGSILAIEGTSWVATDAGVEFLLSEDQLAAFQKKIHATDFPYFNVLLKTTKVANTPLDATIEAFRIYPDLR